MKEVLFADDTETLWTLGRLVKDIAEPREEDCWRLSMSNYGNLPELVRCPIKPVNGRN